MLCRCSGPRYRKINAVASLSHLAGGRHHRAAQRGGMLHIHPSQGGHRRAVPRTSRRRAAQFSGPIRWSMRCSPRGRLAHYSRISCAASLPAAAGRSLRWLHGAYESGLAVTLAHGVFDCPVHFFDIEGFVARATLGEEECHTLACRKRHLFRVLRLTLATLAGIRIGVLVNSDHLSRRE